MKVHRVKSGDTLTGLSTKIYGSPNHVKKIMDANPKLKGRTNGHLSNEDLIFTGETLIIPDADTEEKQEKDEGGFAPTISIDGVKIKKFNSVKIADTYDSIANGLIFEIPNTEKNRKMIPPFKFNAVTCSFRGEKLLNGQIFKTTVVDTATLQISAYNFSQHAVTCNFSPDSYPRNFGKKSLKDVASKLLDGLGVKFKAGKGAEKQFNEVYKDSSQIDYNQNIADFLVSLAQQKDLIIRPDNNTGGIIFDKFEKEEIVLDLVEEKIYSNLSIEFNSEYLYSELHGIKPKGYYKPETREKINNDFFEAQRVFVKLMNSGEKDGVKAFIENEDKKQKKRLFKVNITYPHLIDKNNKLIKSGRAIILQNEKFFINKQVKFLILKVEYDFDSLGCLIEAQPIEIFKGDPIEKFWE